MIKTYKKVIKTLNFLVTGYVEVADCNMYSI